ncbi:hypothetical protein OV079_33170 [Nannocystis pusilla]|uniref:Uncharacterized protein n=1 Tax=Nannocystis pusilla TaxID=889268 RepID=A0A9X3EVZ8_9BACT|nr:hypothetical protein [Nannocystis pusilla]MCY1010335.1 hypothetical protein [Nannocystis pusilla]
MRARERQRGRRDVEADHRHHPGDAQERPGAQGRDEQQADQKARRQREQGVGQGRAADQRVAGEDRVDRGGLQLDARQVAGERGADHVVAEVGHAEQDDLAAQDVVGAALDDVDRRHRGEGAGVAAEVEHHRLVVAERDPARPDLQARLAAEERQLGAPEALAQGHQLDRQRRVGGLADAPGRGDRPHRPVALLLDRDPAERPRPRGQLRQRHQPRLGRADRGRARVLLAVTAVPQRRRLRQRPPIACLLGQVNGQHHVARRRDRRGQLGVAHQLARDLLQQRVGLSLCTCLREHALFDMSFDTPGELRRQHLLGVDVDLVDADRRRPGRRDRPHQRGSAGAALVQLGPALERGVVDRHDHDLAGGRHRPAPAEPLVEAGPLERVDPADLQARALQPAQQRDRHADQRRQQRRRAPRGAPAAVRRGFAGPPRITALRARSPSRRPRRSGAGSAARRRTPAPACRRRARPP